MVWFKVIFYGKLLKNELHCVYIHCSLIYFEIDAYLSLKNLILSLVTARFSGLFYTRAGNLFREGHYQGKSSIFKGARII